MCVPAPATLQWYMVVDTITNPPGITLQYTAGVGTHSFIRGLCLIYPDLATKPGRMTKTMDRLTENEGFLPLFYGLQE
jgi:hypothetical protein